MKSTALPATAGLKERADAALENAFSRKRNHITDRAYVRIVRREARRMDQSHLWPVRNRFNVTERAIRIIAREERRAGCKFADYPAVLESEIERIVNCSH